MDEIVFGESPRWHDGRLWFSDWGAGRVWSVTAGSGTDLALFLMISISFSRSAAVRASV